MTDDSMSAVCAINAPADAVFAVLADPTTHQAIDGTGWVRESLDGKQLTEVTLSYDWSAVPAELREHIQFPPFDRQHLDNSLKHLAGLAQARP
ncbi:hypothetical protein [Mycolicibacterium porcinum]|uniref:Polyketide cyclase n=1 Tax=Mycolicibacterium porcinum TaxID=39693 RepID=A0ABV3V9R8_9MYCO